MSGQWEQYVEKAAVSIDPAAFDKTIENHDGLIRKFRRDRATELAQGVLAVVAPLIAEDTRTRMVEAAAAAVLRDCETDPIAVAARKAFADEIVDFLSRYFPDACLEAEACEDCAVMHDLARVITERAAS